VLYPIIMSRTVRLNSLWVLISILIGAELGDFVGSVFGGFVGALLAVPAGSAVQVVARDLWHHRTDTAEPPTDVARPPRRAIPADAPEGSAGASGTAAGAE
jgi:predicted PurR-regulated permease PerM